MSQLAIRLLTLALCATAWVVIAMVAPADAATSGSKHIRKHHQKRPVPRERLGTRGGESQGPAREPSHGPSGGGAGMGRKALTEPAIPGHRQGGLGRDDSSSSGLPWTPTVSAPEEP